MKVLNKGEIKEQKWKLRNILLAISIWIRICIVYIKKNFNNGVMFIKTDSFLKGVQNHASRFCNMLLFIHASQSLEKRKKNNETWAVEKWNPYRKQRWITSLLSFALTPTRLDFSLLETTANLTPSYLLDIPSNLKNYIDLIQKVSYLFCYWIFVLWQFTTHWATSQKTATRWNLISSPGKK